MRMTSALADALEVKTDPVPDESLQVFCGGSWDRVAVLLPRLMRGLRKEDMEGQRQISLDGFL